MSSPSPDPTSSPAAVVVSGMPSAAQQMNQQVVDTLRAGAGAGGADDDGQPWNDPQFVMQRTAMCDRIYQYLGRGEPPERDLWLPQLTRKLEEILYMRFPNKNDYFHMMKGSVEPQVLFAMDTLKARKVDDTEAMSSGAGQHFEMLRTAMREKIYQHLGRGEPPERDLWLPQLTRKLEEILYVRFPNKNDYFHMMKGPVEPHILFVMDTLKGQKMEDTAPLSSGAVAQQFVMLRTAMREKILEYIVRRYSPAMWGKVLTNMARQLEEILYTKFPNMNDYYNMTKGPIVQPLLFAAKTLKFQRQQIQQDPQMASENASSSGTKALDDVNLDDLCGQFSSLLADMQNNNAEMSASLSVKHED